MPRWVEDEISIHIYFSMAFFGFKAAVEMSILDLSLSLSGLISKRATEGLEHLPGLFLFVCFCFYCSCSHVKQKPLLPAIFQALW